MGRCSCAALLLLPLHALHVPIRPSPLALQRVRTPQLSSAWAPQLDSVWLPQLDSTWLMQQLRPTWLMQLHPTWPAPYRSMWLPHLGSAWLPALRAQLLISPSMAMLDVLGIGLKVAWRLAFIAVMWRAAVLVVRAVRPALTPRRYLREEHEPTERIGVKQSADIAEQPVVGVGKPTATTEVKQLTTLGAAAGGEHSANELRARAQAAMEMRAKLQLLLMEIKEVKSELVVRLALAESRAAEAETQAAAIESAAGHPFDGRAAHPAEVVDVHDAAEDELEDEAEDAAEDELEDEAEDEAEETETSQVVTLAELPGLELGEVGQMASGGRREAEPDGPAEAAGAGAEVFVAVEVGDEAAEAADGAEVQAMDAADMIEAMEMVLPAEAEEAADVQDTMARAREQLEELEAMAVEAKAAGPLVETVEVEIVEAVAVEETRQEKLAELAAGVTDEAQRGAMANMHEKPTALPLEELVLDLLAAGIATVEAFR